MAKDKKKITDFRQALLSNSQFIAKDSEEPLSAVDKNSGTTSGENYTIELSAEVFRKLQKMASDYNLPLNEFANLAIEHVLSISYVQKKNS